MLESNFFFLNIFCLLTITCTSKKKIGITHANHSASLKAHFDTGCTHERLYFLLILHFVLDILLGDRCDRKKKKKKNDYFIHSSKASFFGG